MIQSQKFSVSKSGVVRGGDASYSADLDTGMIDYSYSIKKPWPLSPIEGSSRYLADPQELLSSFFKKSGDKLTIGPVTFTATTIVPGETDVEIAIEGLNMTGSAVLDTSGTYFKILKINASGSMYGFSINLQLNPEK